MRRDQRQRLAAQQAELVAALVRGGEEPAGFDGEQLRVQREMLVGKRRRLVERLRPDLAERLGDRFRGLFDSYAAEHPRPRGSGVRDDAGAFTRWLRHHGHLRRRWFRRG